MDPNTELLLQKAARAKNWEDEEGPSYDLETLRAEFQVRLYGSQQAAPPDSREQASDSQS